MKHEPLKPLIPLDDLKKVVGGLIAVPKPDAAERKQDESPKRPAKTKKSPQ